MIIVTEKHMMLSNWLILTSPNFLRCSYSGTHLSHHV